jgi:D-threo-aldose 1-dehydrogenase
VRRALGGTGLTTGELVLGTSALGFRAGPEQASATLRAAAERGLTDWDTSNGYGRAEEFVGSALRALGGDGIQVFTKADPAPGSDDFSGERVRASVRESQQRLDLDHLPVVHLHDPERIAFDEAMAPDGPVAALRDLQQAGVIGALGVAGGPAALMERYVRTGVFQLLVTHNRFTLLDRSASALLDAAAEHGLGVFNAAPFGGGALTADDGPVGEYHYRPVDDVQRRAVLRIREIARAAGVAVGALALGLSLRDPRITATIVGASRPERLVRILEWAQTDIPGDVWPELDDALPPLEHQTGPDGR